MNFHTSRTDVLATTGFTLLEVMVTMTILGLIVLTIAAAFRAGLSAWERGESTRDDYQRLRTVSQLICQQIKSSVPYKIKTQKAEADYLGFEGGRQSLKLISALPIKGRQPQGFVHAIYEFVEGGSEGGRLVYYEQRVLNNKGFFEEKPEEESGVSLLDGISDLRFEYLRGEDAEKTRSEEWLEEWNAKEEKELPKSVRIKITMKEKENEKAEVPLTLLANIAATKFEEVKTTTRPAARQIFPPGAGRPGYLRR